MRNIGAMVIAVVALFALANVHPVNATTPAPGDVPLVLASADIQTPSNDQVVELAERSMRIFMASVREKSMQGLWTHSSARFREKFPVPQLDKVFKNFYDLKITGDPLAGKSPIFTAGPMINEDSNLVVDGYYATTPWRVSFHLTFIMEGRSWKLVGINVSAKPPPRSGSQFSSGDFRGAAFPITVARPPAAWSSVIPDWLQLSCRAFAICLQCRRQRAEIGKSQVRLMQGQPLVTADQGHRRQG